MFSRVKEIAEAAKWDMHWSGADEVYPEDYALVCKLCEAAEQRDVIKLARLMRKLKWQVDNRSE